MAAVTLIATQILLLTGSFADFFLTEDRLRLDTKKICFPVEIPSVHSRSIAKLERTIADGICRDVPYNCTRIIINIIVAFSMLVKFIEIIT